MASLAWEVAQEEELKWWAETNDRLGDPRAVETKRQLALAIWDGIVSLGVSDNARVLEVGTGGDGFVNFIPPPFRVGVEPLLFRMKARGIGIFSSAARFVCGAGERLPFKSDSFDVVFLYNVLDHMSYPARALGEIARVLRNGGILHLLLDTYAFRFKLYRRFIRPDPMHPHTFTPPEIRRWLKRRGFAVVLDVSDVGPTGKRMARALRVFCSLEK